jgi:putative transposase
MEWASRAYFRGGCRIQWTPRFWLNALEEALARYGRPAIFYTYQGSHFTRAAFTGALTAAGVRISMDGRGRWMDSVFIERLWRSLKHGDVYLKGYADGREAHAGIASWFAFYNATRPHQALGNRTSMAVWHEATVVD